MIFSDRKTLSGITLESATYAALDTETTGIHPWADRIVEIGIVRWKKGSMAAEFLDRVNPEIPIKPGAERIHGISSEELANAPVFRDIAGEVAEALEGTVIIGHRALSFDMPFLNMELARSGIRPLNNIVIDTNLLVKTSLIPGEKRDLSSLARAMGVREGKRHRALHDARLVLGVWLALLNRFIEYGKESLLDILPYFKANIYPQSVMDIFRSARSSDGVAEILYPSGRHTERRRVSPVYYRNGALVAIDEDGTVKSYGAERLRLP
ncbi:MAG: PolC-type DNA polymerase III [Candidatus Hydrothermia bacterium]